MIMRLLGVLLVLGFMLENGFSAIEVNTNLSSRPEVINIGGIFTFSSVIGKVAKIAIKAALDDVNASPHVLHGTKLNIFIQTSNHSGFLGVIEAMRFMERNVVAIVGPQSSVVAHVISHLAEAVQVPLLSFAATDPTLSSLEYPFFVRTGQSDLFKMAAVADIVNYYGWREVVAIYTDDDFGRNGIAALGDKLADNRCTIVYKARMSTDPSQEELLQMLLQVTSQESRILVLHTYKKFGLQVLNLARSLHMLDSGYVWIATDWLTSVIDTDSPLSSSVQSNIQGLLTLRMHTPESHLKRNFLARWSGLVRRENATASFGLNAYGLYAYDTVWILAHALDAYLNQEGNISFSNNSQLNQVGDSSLHLGSMKAFVGGEQLLSSIRRVNMTGLTGHIEFDQDRNLINPTFDIINVVGTGHNTIGYWSNSSGLSIVPPEVLSSKSSNRSSSSQQLFSVIWPGETTEKPRGWVFPENGKVLKIGVPNRVDYKEYIKYSPSTDSFTGYCIDVFTAAINLLPYAVPYKLIPFGNGIEEPDINALVDKMSAGVFDAAIGDIAITTARTKVADFTQPYIESGLVVVAPVKTKKSNAWAFLRPFSPSMWCITLVFFIVVGCVVWILEHRFNDEFRGPPSQQIATILWFSFSTWFFSHRENTVSTLGRLVLIIWLFVVLIITSSYTASLTSILTVQQLSSHVTGIHSLIASNEPIGYRKGSYSYDYLKDELNVPASRLIGYVTQEDFAEAMRKGPNNGGVAAVVDKRAYVELFLSTRCDFAIVGQEFTKNGWGFAFPRESPLATDMSTAILKLSENGDLQRLHDKWLTRSACSSQNMQLEVDRLGLKSFWGLYLICAIACVLALIVYFGIMVKQYIHHYTPEEEDFIDQNGPSPRSSRLQSFLSFADEKEEEIKRRLKKRQMEGSSTRSSTPRYASNRSVAHMSINGSRINHLESSPAQSYIENNEVQVLNNDMYSSKR